MASDEKEIICFLDPKYVTFDILQIEWNVTATSSLRISNVVLKSVPQAESMMAGGHGRVGLLGRVVGPVLVEVRGLPCYLLYSYELGDRFALKSVDYPAIFCTIC